MDIGSMEELEYLMSVNNRLMENLQDALSVIIVAICFLVAFFVACTLIRGWLNA